MPVEYNHQSLWRSPHAGGDFAPCPDPTRILFAEPDARFRVLCAGMLAQAGYAVLHVDNGEMAWDALLSDHFDLVVTEQIMPGASGPSLVRRMRVAHMWQPVILTTENHELEDVWTRDPWQRVDLILPKPFSAGALISRIDDLLHTPVAHPLIAGQ